MNYLVPTDVDRGGIVITAFYKPVRVSYGFGDFFNAKLVEGARCEEVLESDEDSWDEPNEMGVGSEKVVEGVD